MAVVKWEKSEGEGNALFLCDDEKTIRKKIMRAVTDSGPTQLNQQKPDAIKNIFYAFAISSHSRYRSLF
jgi:tryptophanyl-tRNA synthetase